MNDKILKSGSNCARRLLLVFIALLLISSCAEASAWKLSRNIWSEEDEKVYSDFVEAIGDSKYSNLNKFIKDPQANPLYGEEDKKFNLSPDCADLPYILRAYVAYKLRIPFSYVSAIEGKGGDQRYSRGNKPVSFKDQDFFSSPQQVFSQVTLINSGFFRTGVEVEDADFYPVKVNKKSIRPGTVYYDPDGHVAVVAKVTEDGRIRVIDAHPDRTISKPWFGAKFTRGSKTNGGGFKRWRPIRYTADGKVVRTRNHNIADYSADDQFHKSFSFGDRDGLGYHEFIRIAMSDNGGKSDPVKEFVFMMKDLHEDISYRAEAVNLCLEKGINNRPHPGALPWNIYGTDGLWEEFSTPSRDARLKVAFREFYDRTRQMIFFAESSPQGAGFAKSLAATLLQKYEELCSILTVSYVNSAGQRVVLSFDEISQRLYDLSFDPYHAVEYRWGAHGDELATAKDGDTKRRFYDLERKLRNQLERVYNQATPLSMGPDNPPTVDVRGWLTAYLQGNQVDVQIVAFNRETVAPVVLQEPGRGDNAIASMPSPLDTADADAADSVDSADPVAKVAGVAEGKGAVEVAKVAMVAKADENKTSVVVEEDILPDLMLFGDQFASALADKENFTVSGNTD